MTINTKQSTLFTLLVAIACCLVTFEASAANFTVNNTNDSGTNSLREAIDLANGNAEDDVITITATGTITLASNLPVITTNMIITGPGSASLTIDGLNTHKIFDISGTSTVVTIEGITITKGRGKSVSNILETASYEYGGGLYNEDATTTLNDCIFSANAKAHYGGGLFNYSGTMVLNDCDFLNNTAIVDPALSDNTGRAGAFYSLSNVGETASIICNDCLIDGNQSQDIGGGIMGASFDDDGNDSHIEMNDCTIQNNSTTDRAGGGFSLNACTVKINGCIIKNNSAPSQNGGGINCLSAATLTCINTTFEGNSITGSGGAIHSESDEVILQNCIFKENTAVQFGGAIRTFGAIDIDQCTFDGNEVTSTSNGEGGAIYFTSSSGTSSITNSTFINNRSEQYGGVTEQAGGTLNLINCTFTGNSARLSGGAIENYNSAVTNVTNCTVVNNTIDANSADGVGIGNYSSQTCNVTNSIIYNNRIDNGGGAEDNFFASSTIQSGGHNITGEASGLTTGTGDLTNTNPDLGSLQDNGGAVQTFAPNVGTSPAIDHIDNGSAPCTDARLAARTGNADVGAYESGGTFSDVSVSVSPSSVAENSGSNLVFTFTRTGQTCEDLLVNFSVAGTAVLGTDYNASNATTFNSSTGSVVIPDGSSSVSLNVTPINNSATDGSRTIILTITTGSGYNIDGSNSNSTGTITDDESPTIPTITISATTSSVSESISENLVFQFTRTGDTSSALSINFSIAGTAVNSDFTLSGEDSYNTGTNTGTITIPIGASTADLTVTPTDDSLIEANETVVVKIEPSS